MPKRRTFLIAAFLAIIVLTWGPTQRTSAHPADMNFQTHTIVVEDDGLSILWSFHPGPALVPTVWAEADQDGDTLVDGDEAAAWGTIYTPYYFVDLADDTRVPVEVQSVRFPEVSKAIWLGSEGIEVLMFVPLNLDEGMQMRVTNGVEASASTNWFTLEADTAFSVTDVEQNNHQLVFTIAPLEQGLTAWDSGKLSKVNASTTAPGQSEAATRLTSLIGSEGTSAWFYLTALFVSVLLGAVHALTPGHGKAMVGAYLVGSQGTPQHAVALGAIVTLTHTGSVIVFGVLALTATQFFAPTTALPLLELTSGVLIVVFGLVILRQRWVGFSAVRRHQSAPQPQLALAVSGASQPQTISIGKSITVESAIPLTNTLSNKPTLSWKSLAGLGVSGGLVPCPDAVAILLVATAINRLILGLTMTVAFSLGLAVVLILIGLAMVRGRSFVQRFEGFERFAPVLPMLSAIIVILLGVVLIAKNMDVVSVVAASPAVGLAQSMAETIDREPDVVFISDKDGQLYGYDLPTGKVQRLTDFQQRITSLVVSANHQMVAFSVRLDEVDTLQVMAIRGWQSEPRQLLDCIDALCRAGQFHPNGESLLVEWVDQSDPTRQQLSVLQTVDVARGRVDPVFENNAVPSLLPRLSPDAEWLAYVIPGATQITVEGYSTGQQYRIGNGERDVVAWSSDSQTLLYTDYSGDLRLSHLYVLNVGSGASVNLTRDSGTEDLFAAWSPNGEQIAVIRRAEGSLADEVWLLQPDGTGAQMLSAPPEANHYEPVWSADGRYLITSWFITEGKHYYLALTDTKTSKSRLITSSGFKPVWVK